MMPLPDTDLVEIRRPEGVGDIASLDLTLPQAKQLLASVQRAVVKSTAMGCGGHLAGAAAENAT